MNKKIDSVIVKRTNTIKEVMQSLDKSALGIALVLSDNGKLEGVVNDGDIRRAILKGKDLGDPIAGVMNTRPITALQDTSAQVLLKLMLEKGIKQIPIVSCEGALIDLALLSELMSIPLSNPDITQKEIEVVTQVLSTSYLSIGPKIREFEDKVASFSGMRHAVAVNSGTSALHLCIRSLDIKDRDEVITTPFSFISSANCMLFERAIPVFVDIDKDTLCIDVKKIKEKITPRTKAILPVHVFGHPCQMDEIMNIAKENNLAVIEDACEAIGAEFKNKKVGSFGDAGVFAFYPNKQITTAEGGIMVTNSDKIASLCRSMRNQGRDEDGGWLAHKRLGYNYRMSELSAALGVVQMDRITEILQKRQSVADLYGSRLRGIDGIKTPYVASGVKMSWFVYVVRLDKQRYTAKDRDIVLQRLKSKGIACSNYFAPIHLQPFYEEQFGYKLGDFPVTESVSGLTIALPFYNNLNEPEVDYICENLKSVLASLSK